MAKAGLQIFSDLREQSDAPWEEAMLKPPTTENALIDRRGILRTGAALAAVGPALLHGEHAKAQPSTRVANDDHRCPGSCLRGKHAGTALAQRAQLASSRHRRRDGCGDEQGGC